MSLLCLILCLGPVFLGCVAGIVFLVLFLNRGGQRGNDSAVPASLGPVENQRRREKAAAREPILAGETRPPEVLPLESETRFGAAGKSDTAKAQPPYEFLTPPQKADEIGRLATYRVLKVLGKGGMGLVFQAEDTWLKRLVALKVMTGSLADNESARQRFLREAQAAAAIEHDHIVRIYQVGEDRGIPFIAMELLRGEAVEQRLEREGRLPLPQAIRIGKEAAIGLAAAHRQGLVHRDVKPANLWLEAETDRIKILDFGLARACTGENAQLTRSGVILGTPAYMSPEQANGKTLDARSDLFSLGCVLYRLCVGDLPFKGPDTLSTLVAVAMHDPKPPSELDPSVPDQLSDLIMKLLAKDPQARPATASEVAESLGKLAIDCASVPAPSSAAVVPNVDSGATT